jgi:DNA (cytosine-5)-methyltransferase 1
MGTGGGNVPMVMEQALYEWHNQDSRVTGPIDVACTLNTNAGGREGHLVIEPCFCLQGNGIDRADTAGCNGKGVKENICYTLNTIDRPAVAYGLDRASFNQGQNAKFDFSVQDEQQPTLTARGPGAVCCTTGSYTQVTEEVSPTLMVRDWEDPTLVCANYIVRRLTPTECARLQGFADRWGDIEAKSDLTDEEYRFWHDVRNTHAAINGKAVKEYTKAQMLTWYNKLHTDSAEYKMWGNGIALPCALFVIEGIKDVVNGVKPAKRLGTAVYQLTFDDM